MAMTTAVIAGQGGETSPVREIDVNERPMVRRSHQFRALSRRTATYHLRHWKLDLCCLGLCPAFRHLFLQLTIRISVIIAGVLGVVAQHFSDISSTNQTFLSEGCRIWNKLISGVLSCSDIGTQTNPSLFPNQDTDPQYIIVNGVKMEAVNFHIEPFRIGNVFQSTR